MKTASSLLITIVFFLMIARTSVSFKPFKITFESGYLALGVLFFMASMIFIRQQGYKEGLKRGYEITIEETKKILTEKSEKL